MNFGAFVISRGLFESEIRQKPPEYIKLWIYLLGKANHKDKKYGGYEVKRGQCFVTYEELNDQLKYNIGFRKKLYNESFVKNYMKRLRSTLMIDSMKKPRGVLVTILNYCKYQDFANYENTNENTNEKTSDKLAINQSSPSINKNDNNDKEGKEEIISKDTTIVEGYVPDPITLEINNVISELKNKMNDYGIVYSGEDERMFGKHILSKKRNKTASQYKFSDGIEFAKFIIDCSMQDGNWRKYKVCSIKLLYQKYAQIINSYQEAKDKKSSNVSSF